ncbi:crustacean hyperglycemic hormone A-like [Dermatophagoides pteronyssinus]|uniref:crustacean hyperglycemic hormone A-like n=1 Tax=Dermatophagoides pteronyssinus TaxID=6956 RepID=UPI003F678EB3
MNKSAITKRIGILLISFLLFMASFAINGSESRSFTILGCLGDYDLSKFAQLDRICDECYILYREPELNFSCRKDCFRNEVFGNCVDALYLSHEKKKLLQFVDQIFG